MAHDLPREDLTGRIVILPDGRKAAIRRVIEDDEMYIVDVVGEERRADTRDRLVLAKSVKLVAKRTGRSEP